MSLRSIMLLALLPALWIPSLVEAQVPPVIEAELRKLGQIVSPGCTAKLYRGLMPDNDYNTYWPVDADAPNTKIKLYKGLTLSRDVQFGSNPKDLVDIFVGDKGAAVNRTILIYVPGGGGNKIEQQSVEANAFYDNIGRWATDEGMVGITLQRSAANIPVLIDWLKANAAKYKGNPDRIFIWAHSAGNGPLGQYIGRPDLHGIGVKGAIFMSGNPVNFNAPAAGGRGAAPNAGGPQPPCVEGAGIGGAAGAIRGPSSQLPDMGKEAAAQRKALAGASPVRWTGKAWESTGAAPPPQTAGGRGAGGGRGAAGGPPPGGGQQAAQPGFTVQDGFRTTRVAILLARAELDPGVSGDMTAGDKAIHDELCKLEGPKAKDGVGHCPTMLFLKNHSHMSEVFSIGTADKTVSGPILAWIKSVQ